MNVFDLLILLVLVLFVFKGFRRGFLREIAGLLGIVFAFILAVRLMDDFSLLLGHFLGLSPRVAVLVTAVAIFIVALIAILMLARMIRKVMDLAALGWIDRLLGSLFGLAKGVVIVSILALIISLLPVGGEFNREKKESFLFEPMRKAAPLLFNGIAKMIPAAQDFYTELKQSLSDSSGGISREAMNWLNSLSRKVPSPGKFGKKGGVNH